MRSRLRPGLLFILVLLALFTATRVSLLVRTLGELNLTPARLARILGTGLGFDLAVVLYASLPLVWLIAFVPGPLWRVRAVRFSAHAAAILALFVFLFAAAAEWFFWGEFAARFNFIAIDYLVYTRELLDNILESYPVGPLSALAFALAVALWAVFVRAPLDAALASSNSKGWRPRAATAVATSAAALACFSLTPDRPPRVDPNRYANELAANGLYNLFSAFRNNVLDYAPFYVTEDPVEASHELRILLDEPRTRFASDDPVGLTRSVVAARPERRLNVVLIVVESLSARYLGAFGNHKGLTPNLDRLAADGLLFTDLHATGTRTVRGLEAIALSAPPTPGYSIIKRPGNAHLFTIGTVFRERGYRTRFFYGGYSYFDNMGPFFQSNGFEVIDRADLSGDEAEFSNAWGVSDEFVFRRVLREARRSHAAGEHFLSLVLTTSNHRPFTYPEGRIDPPPGDERGGAIKYTDYAIGKFIDDARSEPFFADTVFVIVADHCAGSAGEVDIPVGAYHIPMIIFSPGHVAAGRAGQLASQMDVAPTLLELLGFSYRSRFFGRDILAMQPRDERALLGTYERLGYLKNDLLTVLSPVRRVDVYRVGSNGHATPLPARAGSKELEEAIAYYQSASEAFASRTPRAIRRRPSS